VILSVVSSAEAKSWQPEIKDEGVVVTVVTLWLIAQDMD
jgi:hypothetical protein